MTEKDTILVAEDVANDVLLLQIACKKAELFNPMQIVRNGDEAINYLQGAGPFSDRSQFPNPRILLLDLNMPRKSGFEVLAWLRIQPRLRRLPVFIFTASMRAADIECAYELGTNAFLVKPTAMPDLVDMMRCLRDWLRCNQFPPV
jgi:CheY-like chemotaxis protein